MFSSSNNRVIHLGTIGQICRNRSRQQAKVSNSTTALNDVGLIIMVYILRYGCCRYGPNYFFSQLCRLDGPTFLLCVCLAFSKI